MDKELLKRRLAHLNKDAFRRFAIDVCTNGNDRGHYDGMSQLADAGPDVFSQPCLDSYGGSIQSIFVLHCPPFELFRPSRTLNMLDPVLVAQLARVRNIYAGRTGQWGMVSPHLRRAPALASIAFLTNLFGIEKPVYEDVLIPAYQRLKRFCGLKRPRLFVGSCDSFIDLSPNATHDAFCRVACKHADGLVVTVRDGAAVANDYSSERCLGSGVFSTQFPYEPLFVNAAITQRAVLEEFNSLLQENPQEARLEEFIAAHFQDLFGQKYDRIETQLWMRFPNADIGGKNRRFDVFLRNSVINDWELFEVKRAVRISGTQRDVPLIANEVTKAVHQIKNYRRILAQDKVRRHFASLGIEYFEPQMSVIIGRTPEIAHAQWRWLRTVNEDQVRIITFDDLMAELRCRIEDRLTVFEEAQRIASAPT